MNLALSLCLASLRKVRDAHRPAGSVPIAVLATLIAELEEEPGAGAWPTELESLGERVALVDRPRAGPQ